MANRTKSFSENIFWTLLIALSYLFIFPVAGGYASLASGLFLYLEFTRRTLPWWCYVLGSLIPFVLSLPGWFPYHETGGVIYLATMPLLIPLIRLVHNLTPVRQGSLGLLSAMLLFTMAFRDPSNLGQYFPWVILVAGIATFGFTWPYLASRNLWWTGFLALMGVGVIRYSLLYFLNLLGGKFAFGRLVILLIGYPMIVDIILLDILNLMLVRRQDEPAKNLFGGRIWRNRSGSSSTPNIHSNSGAFRKRDSVD